MSTNVDLFRNLDLYFCREMSRNVKKRQFLSRNLEASKTLDFWNCRLFKKPQEMSISLQKCRETQKCRSQFLPRNVKKCQFLSKSLDLSSPRSVNISREVSTSFEKRRFVWEKLTLLERSWHFSREVDLSRPNNF